jgi:hypothetical protein
MEDSATDIMVSMMPSNASSIEDATAFVRTNLPKLVTDYDALVLSGATSRIAVKILLYSLGKAAPLDGALAKLVSKAKLADKYKTPLVSLYNIGGTPKVVFRTPLINSSDTLSKRNLEAVFTLAHYCLGVKAENISYVMDKELGTSFVFEQVHINLVDQLTGSAASPLGVFPGELINYGQYKGTLPCILSSLHLLSRKQNFIRRRTPSKKEDVVSVSSVELRRIFNIRTGLSDKTNSYGCMLLKGLLSVITSSKNKVFPGGWITSNRQVNNVKTDTGLLYKMGYTEKSVYNHKLDTIIFNDVTIKPDMSRHIRNKSDEKEYKSFSFKEFRTAVVLTACRIDPTSLVPYDVQVKRDPLSLKSDKILDNLNDTKYHKAIDSVNRAHALFTTIGDRAKKTKAIHYEIARNELLHLTVKVPLKDGLGNKYSKVSELPKPILDFCCKRYRFQFKKGKRTSDDTLSDEDMEDVQEVTPPAKKVLQVAKPVAEASTPRSGASTPLKRGAPIKKAPLQKK